MASSTSSRLAGRSRQSSSLQSGQPFTVYTSASFPSGDFNGDGYNFDVPTRQASETQRAPAARTSSKVFLRRATFRCQMPGRKAISGRIPTMAPDWQMSTLRERSSRSRFLGERAASQLRGEILNLFNRVNLTNACGRSIRTASSADRLTRTFHAIFRCWVTFASEPARLPRPGALYTGSRHIDFF